MNRTTGATSTALPMPSSPSLQPLVSQQPDADDENDGDLSVLPSSQSSPLSWDHLRRQARQIENEIELKLASLSKLGASVASRSNGSPSSGGNDSFPMGKPSQELEIEELLKKVYIFYYAKEKGTYVYIYTGLVYICMHM